MRLLPSNPPACPDAVTAIDRADLVVLGPGSWFSSVIPHVLVPELVESLSSTNARRCWCSILHPSRGRPPDSPQSVTCTYSPNTCPISGSTTWWSTRRRYRPGVNVNICSVRRINFSRSQVRGCRGHLTGRSACTRSGKTGRCTGGTVEQCGSRDSTQSSCKNSNPKNRGRTLRGNDSGGQGRTEPVSGDSGQLPQGRGLRVAALCRWAPHRRRPGGRRSRGGSGLHGATSAPGDIRPVHLQCRCARTQCGRASKVRSLHRACGEGG